jgi:hypothetical protein
MPVFVDLGQFPRLVCRRCGLVALVDPSLPMDERPSLTCPNCHKPLSQPADRLRDTRPSETRSPQPAKAPKPSPAAGPVPSNAAVGLAIAAIFMLLLIGLFVVFAVFSVHGPGFGSAAK